ncbi:unnamed protein product [Plutella xylostella]|uniref:(diamondback moth) hypothetical protein n=1 Tax=Plutella xylostella TaxID=51655 RepID=A0A8S4G4V6_PLUXY|nr:unnamed protein product [Plutella xylostella]
MSWPQVSRACGLPLRAGAALLAVVATLVSLGGAAAGGAALGAARLPEDKFLAMSLLMFSALSLASNLAVLYGIWRRREGCVQFAQLFNSLFMVFLFLVGAVSWLLSPALAPRLRPAPPAALALLALLSAAAFCFYYLLVVNSMYRRMKADSDTIVPA